MIRNLNPTNYINTTAPVMWNVAGTHTHEPNDAKLHAYNHSPEEKRWVLGAELTILRIFKKIFFIRCDVEWYVV